MSRPLKCISLLYQPLDGADLMLSMARFVLLATAARRP